MNSRCQGKQNRSAAFCLRRLLLTLGLVFVFACPVFASDTLTLDGNGGAYNGSSTVELTIPANGALKLDAYSFTRDGYIQVGWEWDRPDGRTDWSIRMEWDPNTYPATEGVREFRAKWAETLVDSVAILYATKEKYLTQDRERYRILRENEILPDTVWAVSDEGKLTERRVLEWRSLYKWDAYAVGETVAASDELVRLTPVLAEPVQLPTPTELSWNLDYHYRGTDSDPADVPGMISWKTVADAAMVRITIYYRANETDAWEALAGYRLDSEDFPDGKHCSSPVFMQRTNMMESGYYCFAVQALGNGTDYLDSEVSEKSEVFFFEEPEQWLSCDPVHARWRGREMQWDVEGNGEDVLGYWLTIYNGTSGHVLAKFFPAGTEVTTLKLPLAQRFGDGTYAFQVVAVPNDITQYHSARGFASPYRMLCADGAGPDGVAVSLPDPYTGREAACAILAVYDNNGRLIGVAEEKASDQADSYCCPALACDSTKAAYGKVFYMNSNGTPACAAEVFDFVKNEHSEH